VRTPSERNRARSLDDLSKNDHSSDHQLGSDNGLDKLDWNTPFKPVASPSHWHSITGQASNIFLAKPSLHASEHHLELHDENEVNSKKKLSFERYFSTHIATTLVSLSTSFCAIVLRNVAQVC
jgi:hypothetical protein